MVYSHKRSEVSHPSLPLEQEWEQADCSSLPFDVEIMSSGTMNTEISPSVSNAARALSTKIGNKNTVTTEKSMRQEMPELGLLCAMCYGTIVN